MLKIYYKTIKIERKNDSLQLLTKTKYKNCCLRIIQTFLVNFSIFDYDK